MIFHVPVRALLWWGIKGLALLFQHRALVHRDVLGFIAFDLILRIFLGRMMRVTFVFNVFFVNLYNSAADISRL